MPTIGERVKEGDVNDDQKCLKVTSPGRTETNQTKVKEEGVNDDQKCLKVTSRETRGAHKQPKIC